MLSHRGMVRHANEDACGARPDVGAYVVCDGVGGAAAGEVASTLAMATFLDHLTRPQRIAPRRALPGQASAPHLVSGSGAPDAGNGHATVSPGSAAPHTRLEEAVRSANQAVFRQAQRSRSLRGMGTTLVGLLFQDSACFQEPADFQGPADSATPASPTPASAEPASPSTAATASLCIAHVGDSRCYRLRNGQLRLLTEDHSLVQEQIRAGVISHVQAAASPIRNIITRAVGTHPAVEPEIHRLDAQPGDLYLLASDGLTRELEDEEIAAILSRAAARPSSEALHNACQTLIDAANARGGGDNTTVLLVCQSA